MSSLLSPAVVTVLSVVATACMSPGRPTPALSAPSLSAPEPTREAVRLVAEAVSVIHTQYVHDLPLATLGLASLRGLEEIPPKGAIRLVETGEDVRIVHARSGAPEASVSVSLSALRSVSDVVRALVLAMEFVEARTATSGEDIARVLVRGLIRVDPHGGYLDPKEAAILAARKPVADVGLDLKIRVDWKRLGSRQGYLRIRDLRKESASEAQAALDALRAAGVNGIVLDLRGNGGGLLTAAVEIAELFLPERNLITYTEGRTRTHNMRFSAHARRPTLDAPLVVLVDEGTSAGAEIVAGALQTTIPLPGRSLLRLTTAQWFTPRGRSVDRRGLAPDIEVALVAGGERFLRDPERDVQLQRAMETLRAALTSTPPSLPP